MSKFTITQKETIVKETKIDLRPGDHISATIPSLWSGWFDGYIESVNKDTGEFKFVLFDSGKEPDSYTWCLNGHTDLGGGPEFQIKLRNPVI